MYFTADTMIEFCNTVSLQDADLASIITEHGYPPYWHRPNNFETLVRIILEQQVSLASAQATYKKLEQRLGTVTPEALLTIADSEFTRLFVSRQKKSYLQGLAIALQTGQLDLTALPALSDDAVRIELTKLKGIGDWTVDIYLIMVMHRPDVFPLGDIAAITSLRELKQLPKTTDKAAIAALSQNWQPHRTAATLLLWHRYLSLRGRSYIA